MEKTNKLPEFREYLNINTIHSSSYDTQIRMLLKENIDYDVYMPSKKMNLQRGFVWSDEQKSELITSFYNKRYIPPVCLVQRYTSKINLKEKDFRECSKLLIVDGKQRLNALLGFTRNEFQWCNDYGSFYFKDLPENYQLRYLSSHIKINVKYCDGDTKVDPTNKVSDDELIKWFRLINLSGTQQEAEHMDKLTNAL